MCFNSIEKVWIQTLRLGNLAAKDISDLCLGVLKEGRWVGAWLHGEVLNLSSPGWLRPQVPWSMYMTAKMLGLGTYSIRSRRAELSSALRTQNGLLSENQSPRCGWGPFCHWDQPQLE